MAIEKRATTVEWATSRPSRTVRGHRTLRTWVARPVDHRASVGLTYRRACSLEGLERENRDCGAANEILKDASIFFATELDGRTKR